MYICEFFLGLKYLKKLNSLNPEQMKQIFHKTAKLIHKLFDIGLSRSNITKYGKQKCFGCMTSDLECLTKEEAEQNKYTDYVDNCFSFYLTLPVPIPDQEKKLT